LQVPEVTQGSGMFPGHERAYLAESSVGFLQQSLAGLVLPRQTHQKSALGQQPGMLMGRTKLFYELAPAKKCPPSTIEIEIEVTSNRDKARPGIGLKLRIAGLSGKVEGLPVGIASGCCFPTPLMQ